MANYVEHHPITTGTIVPVPTEVVLRDENLPRPTPQSVRMAMASISQSTPAKITEDAIRETFLALANQWERETAMLSSPEAMEEHDAYKALLI